jgi:hypothetical protein
LSRSSSGTSASAVTAPPATGGRPAGAFAALSSCSRSKRFMDSASGVSPGSTRRESSFLPPNMKKTTMLSRKLKMNELANSNSASSARASRSTTPLTIEPKTLIGENPPAVAPLMIISPISSGLIP